MTISKSNGYISNYLRHISVYSREIPHGISLLGTLMCMQLPHLFTLVQMYIIHTYTYSTFINHIIDTICHKITKKCPEIV